MVRQSRQEMLDENRERIARTSAELIADIRDGVSEGKLVVTLDYMEQLLRQRRRIKANRGGDAYDV